MRAFMVNEGIPVYAVNFSQPLKPVLDKKVTKKKELYFIEDVQVDPIGSVGIGPNDNSIGSSWASEGFYGFQLPNNNQGYDLMLVHTADLEVY